MTDKNLGARLAQANCTHVVAQLRDGTTRELRPNKGNRKRWVPVLGPLASLDWERLEIFRGDVTVDVVDRGAGGVDRAPASTARESCPTCGRLPAGDELELLIRGQEVAAKWRNESDKNALDAMLGVTKEMQGAVGGLSKIHRDQVDNLMAQLREQRRENEQLRDALDRAPVFAGDDDDDVGGVEGLMGRNRKLLDGVLGKFLGGDDGIDPEQLVDVVSGMPDKQLARIIRRLPPDKVASVMRAVQRPAKSPAATASKASSPAASNGAGGNGKEH